MVGIFRVPASGFGRRGTPSAAASSFSWASACSNDFQSSGVGWRIVISPSLVFAGFDLQLVVEGCLVVGVEEFVVAVGVVVGGK